MPGQVTGRWTVHACRLTILSDDLHFAHAFPSMSRSTEEGEEKEKRKGRFYLARLSETRRKEERIGEGRKIFTFSICIHFTHMERNNKERERGKSLEIEARKLFCSSSITLGYRGGSKNLSKKKKKWTFVGLRGDGLSLASGLLFVICVYFYRSLICRMQLTVKQCRVAKRTTTRETRSLASKFIYYHKYRYRCTV